MPGSSRLERTFRRGCRDLQEHWPWVDGTLLAVFLLLLLSGLLLRNPDQALLPACSFKARHGVDCPSCGMTHAVLAAFQGRLSESWRWHPFGLPFAAFVGLQAGIRGFRMARRRRMDLRSIVLDLGLLLGMALLLGGGMAWRWARLR